MEIVQSYALRLQFADSGKDYITLKSEITIGRSSECDLPFPNSRVISRIHARIFYRDNAWYLVDTNSFNGTWLNKKRIEPNREYILNPGDELDFAHACVMIFLEGDAPDAMESAAASVSPVWTAAPNKQVCHCCGSPVTGIFCSHCGSRIEDPQPTVLPNPANRPTQRKFCICCGMPASGMYCRYCGSRIDGTTPTPGFMDSSSSVPPVPMPAPSASMPAPLPQASMAPQPVHSVKKAQPKAAPKKPGLLSKVGALLGGKATPTTKTPAAPMPTPVTPDDVQFRGTAPKTINPGEYFPVKIMMYREDDYQRADRESANVADQVKSASSSVFQAKKGQEFRITLQSPDIDLDGESQQLCWNGKFAAADFEAFLPQEYDRSQVRIRGRVYSGDAVLTDLKLILQVQVPQPQDVLCEKVLLQSAFISYASADRAKVVARIQGIQLARPDMELFFDVESLRRGEQWEKRLYHEISERDLFYLFWSKNAASSDWVQKELQCALAQKTADFIEPIPLEGPETCPPPKCLESKHFNDWTLRYINNQ